MSDDDEFKCRARDDVDRRVADAQWQRFASSIDDARTILKTSKCMCKPSRNIHRPERLRIQLQLQMAAEPAAAGPT